MSKEVAVPGAKATNPDNFMILLVGIPGSGKSSFAEEMVRANPEKYVRISQDELKKRKKCEKKAREVLGEGKCAIIDRCNFDHGQRAKFINIALELGRPVDCIVFDVPKEECIKRCTARDDHPTIKPSEAVKIVSMVHHDYRPPVDPHSENIRTIHILNNPSTLQHILSNYME